MNTIVKRKYLIGYILFCILYIGMHLLVNWQNIDHIGYNGDTIFSNLSIYDFTIAPPIFAIKFLYLATFIFGVFLLFDKPISFEAILTAVILSNLFFYLPQLVNFYFYFDNSAMLTYGELKNYNWASVLGLFPNLIKEKIIVAYLKEINLFVLAFLLIATRIIKLKNKKYYVTFGLISLGYFSSMYFATTVITFLSVLL